MYQTIFTAPRISILSDSAKHVEHQSALNLTCVVNAVASEAQSGGQKWPKMVWYKDGKVSSLIILLCRLSIGIVFLWNCLGFTS